MIIKNPVTRRHLLKAGAFSLTLPALETFAPRKANAQDKKLRAIFVYMPDGTMDEGKFGGPTWFPRGSETNFTLSPLTQPYAGIKDDTVFVDGAGNFTAKDRTGHGDMMHNCLTCGGKPSIDQVIAEAWKDKGTAFASMQFGIGTDRGGSRHGRLSYNHLGNYIAPEPNPLQIYNKLFGAADLLPKRQSIIDAVGNSFRFVRGRVSMQDKQRLDAHADSLRDIERSLIELQRLQAECAAPDPATWDLDKQVNWTGASKTSIPNFEKVAAAQTDLLAIAVRCDMTRVATLHYQRSNSGQKYPWLNVGTMQHGLAHNWPNGNKDNYAKVQTWRSEMFVRLVEAFKNTPDDDGNSMLDNMVIMHTSEMGNGSHDVRRIPMAIAGKAGGTLRTGRLVKYDHDEPHSNVFTAIARLLGLDVTFGIDATGPAAGLL